MPLGPAYYQDALVNRADPFDEAALSRMSDDELHDRIRHTAARLVRSIESFGQGPRSREAFDEIEDELDRMTDLIVLEESRRDAATVRDDAA